MDQQIDTRTHILTTGRRLTARHGYTGVGLSTILKEAAVPKGSFYHYFASKEAYGCALLDAFVKDYGHRLTTSLAHPDMDARTRFLTYFEEWQKNQVSRNPQDRCLVVKLSAEVADLSDDMSRILEKAVSHIITRLARTIEDGAKDGTIAAHLSPMTTAQTVYHMWLGASLVASISHSDAALRAAMDATKTLVPAP